MRGKDRIKEEDDGRRYQEWQKEMRGKRRIKKIWKKISGMTERDERKGMGRKRA